MPKLTTRKKSQSAKGGKRSKSATRSKSAKAGRSKSTSRPAIRQQGEEDDEEQEHEEEEEKETKRGSRKGSRKGSTGGPVKYRVLDSEKELANYLAEFLDDPQVALQPKRRADEEDLVRKLRAGRARIARPTAGWRGFEPTNSTSGTDPSKTEREEVYDAMGDTGFLLPKTLSYPIAAKCTSRGCSKEILCPGVAAAVQRARIEVVRNPAGGMGRKQHIEAFDKGVEHLAACVDQGFSRGQDLLQSSIAFQSGGYKRATSSRKGTRK